MWELALPSLNICLAWLLSLLLLLLLRWAAWPSWRKHGAPALALATDEEIVVAGAGLAGLAVAIRLCRMGLRVCVVEQRATPSDAGSGMSVIGHSLTLLAELGVDLRSVELGRVQPDVTLREAATGRVAFRVPTLSADRDLAIAFGGSVQVNVQRGKLFRALLKVFSSEPNGRLLTNKRLTCVTSAAEGSVILDFDDGVRQSCALLVGADGVHSTVRGHVQQKPAPIALYRGYTCWRGMLSEEASRDPQLLADLGAMAGDNGQGMFKTVLSVPGTRSSFTTGLAGPCRRFWVLDVGGLPAHTRVPACELRGFLDKQMVGYHTAMRAIVARTDLSQDCIQTDVYDLGLMDCLRRHSRGRVVLIGDAAHPVVHHFGQGACLAFEDAAALCRQIERHGPTADAIAAYDTLPRRLRAAAILLLSRWCGDLYLSPMSAARAVLRVSFAWPLRLLFVYVIQWLLFTLGRDLRPATPL